LSRKSEHYRTVAGEAESLEVEAATTVRDSDLVATRSRDLTKHLLAIENMMFQHSGLKLCSLSTVKRTLSKRSTDKQLTLHGIKRNKDSKSAFVHFGALLT
jgi:uncharacterized protein YaiI (UPF0178 family)